MADRNNVATETIGKHLDPVAALAAPHLGVTIPRQAVIPRPPPHHIVPAPFQRVRTGATGLIDPGEVVQQIPGWLFPGHCRVV